MRHKISDIIFYITLPFSLLLYFSILLIFVGLMVIAAFLCFIIKLLNDAGLEEFFRGKHGSRDKTI